MEQLNEFSPQLVGQSINGRNINQKENEFRGVISNGKNNYFIINELFSSEHTKSFSAIQISLNSNNKVESVSNDALTIKYISKKYLQDTIFKDLQITEEGIEKYYESLRKNFSKYQTIEHKNLQKLYDFIEDENGLYFIVEFCEYTLNDFAEMTREPMKNSKYPIELKFRKIITDILICLQYIHSEGLCLCSLINLNDIYIKETSRGQNKSAFQVKLPHPFLAHLYTLLALKSKGDSFPSYFSPEVYLSFAKRPNNGGKDSFDGIISMLNELDQNFDTWALGFLIYQIIYNCEPFKFESIEDANNKFNQGLEFTYEIYPWKISYHLLKIISDCLKLDPKKRIQYLDFKRIIKEINSKNEDEDILEKELKERIDRMNKDKDPVPFNLVDDLQAENYIK